MFRFSLWSAAAVLGLLASLACGTRAQADNLNLGGSFNGGYFYTFNGDSPGGGGPVDTSYLNGTQLPYVYCIDIPDIVYVPVDYPNTKVTNNATVIIGNTGGSNPGNTDPPWVPVTPGSDVYTVPNAEAIAKLLTLYGLQAGSSVPGPGQGSALLQDALQAAIWTEIYNRGVAAGNPGGGNPSVNPSAVFFVTDPATYNQMVTDLAGIVNETDVPLSNFFWLSPSVNGSDVNQALVTSAAPEPSSFAIAGLGALAIAAYGLRRRGTLGA